MSTDNTRPNWTNRIIAGFAMAIALVGGLGVFKLANREPKSPTVVSATSCRGFEADAHKLLAETGAAALSGTFAPGDHVHLAIDLNGVDYSWELTGALGKKPKVKGSGWFELVKTRKIYTMSVTSGLFTTSAMSRGDIHGYARLEMDIDVTAAGDGAITLSRIGGAPSFISSKVVSASCKPSGKKSLQPMV